MKRAQRNQVSYSLSKADVPVLRVEPGETFALETQDCWGGQIRSPSDVFSPEKAGFANPATGPVYVDGAKPGDILRVDVEQIKMNDRATMCVWKGGGALGDFIEGVETTILPIKQGLVFIREGMSMPVSAMIGVLGTAPACEPVSTTTPGEHGGNLDCREIGPGASVYFPVNAEGALLYAGDLHALMGDGEVCICGAEVAGEVLFKTEIIRKGLPLPCVETPGHVDFLGSAKTLDECEKIVLRNAHRYLVECLGASPNEAARIMSLVGNLGVCQVVDPLKTMRFRFNKHTLQALGMGRRVYDY